MKKTLAIDFDDVLCETTRAFLDFNKYKYGFEVSYEDVGVDVYKALGISETEEIKRWSEFFDAPEFCYLIPVVGMIEALQKLKDEYKLIILTARAKEWHAQIPTWIERYVPGIFEEIVFTADLDTENKAKGGFCKNRDIYALVDDEPEQVRSCVECGVRVFVFDRPWNKEVSREAIRIKSFSEIMKYLN